jgi:recombination protein RecR
MNLSSNLLEAAVREFAKLPGIGKKTALRLVLHLLKQETNEVKQFSETISQMRTDIKFCSRCFNISDDTLCTICSNPSRKKDII